MCDLFVGIDINKGSNSYLDIYMDGNAHGWVAVGFSDTPDMVHGNNVFYRQRQRQTV